MLNVRTVCSFLSVDDIYRESVCERERRGRKKREKEL